MCVGGFRGRVRIESTVSEHFEISNGVRQGSALFLLLINISMEKEVRTVKISNFHTDYTAFGRCRYN